MADQNPLMKALRSFAHAMGGSYDLAEMATELSESITQVLSVTGAGVSVPDDAGNLRFVTATSEQITEIERVQEEDQNGPCVDAYRNNKPITVADVVADGRWPAYSETATSHGIHAVLGYPLTYNERSIGSINVYNSQPKEWNDDDLDLLGVLADMATAYLVRMSELAESKKLSGQLQHALDSRVLIEQAKGKLAGEHGISVDEAFELLRNHSRTNNIKLADLSDAVVNRGLTLAMDREPAGGV
jgi:GAF domain-containing protein